jgi:hypothetical protein
MKSRTIGIISLVAVTLFILYQLLFLLLACSFLFGAWNGNSSDISWKHFWPLIVYLVPFVIFDLVALYTSNRYLINRPFVQNKKLGLVIFTIGAFLLLITAYLSIAYILLIPNKTVYLDVVTLIPIGIVPGIYFILLGLGIRKVS